MIYFFAKIIKIPFKSDEFIKIVTFERDNFFKSITFESDFIDIYKSPAEALGLFAISNLILTQRRRGLAELFFK